MSLDELGVFVEEIEPPTPTGDPVDPRKCTRHKWVLRMTLHGMEKDDGTPDPRNGEMDTAWVCTRCGKLKDDTLSRRGNNNRKRGGRIQRERIVALGGRNLAGNNPNLDGLGAMFAYESKSGAAFSDRIWRWLSGIPKRGNETGVLIVTEAPGPGHKARSYVVVEFDEWRDLHGEGGT